LRACHTAIHPIAGILQNGESGINKVSLLENRKERKRNFFAKKISFSLFSVFQK
jgi:hypothetical protein